MKVRLATGVITCLVWSSFLVATMPVRITAQETQKSAAALISHATPGLFVDITRKSGVSFKYQASHTSKKYLIETMGPGVAPEEAAAAFF